MTVSQTTRFGIYRWSEDSDAFTRQQLDSSHASIETKGAIFTRGSTLPSPNPEHTQSFFYKTDTSTLYYFNGTDNTGSWVAVGQFGSTGQMATLAYGQTNSAGVVDATARIDHVHALPVIDTASLIPKNILTAKGDLIVASSPSTPSVQGIGADGQVLQADSTSSTGVAWKTVSLSGNVPLSTINAKGDLLVGQANDTVERLPIGTNRQTLTADSNALYGVTWTNSPLLRKYSEEARDSGTITTSSFALGDSYNVEAFTLGTNVTLSLLYPTWGSGGPTTEVFTLTLIVRNDGTSGRVLTFPASVKWPNSVRPNEDTSANKTNIWTLTTVNGGTSWFGFLSGRGFS